MIYTLVFFLLGMLLLGIPRINSLWQNWLDFSDDFWAYFWDCGHTFRILRVVNRRIHRTQEDVSEGRPGVRCDQFALGVGRGV
jgi:hypothetical protein